MGLGVAAVWADLGEKVDQVSGSWWDAALSAWRCWRLHHVVTREPHWAPPPTTALPAYGTTAWTLGRSTLRAPAAWIVAFLVGWAILLVAALILF
jgi:hypothetical protein